MPMTHMILKEVGPEVHDDVQYCPVCHRLITQHIITSGWKDLDICNCGWISGREGAKQFHQSKFYKIIPSHDQEDHMELVETIPHN